MTCAVIFSSPYWFSAVMLKEYVDYECALNGYFTAKNHLVYFEQLLSRNWGFGGSQLGLADGMSFQLGMPHFIAALVGVWLNKKNIFYISIFVLYLVVILMMTPSSAVIWNNVPLLNMVQFPWRLLTVITLLQIICISGWYKAVDVMVKNKVIYHVLLVFIIIFVLIWNCDQFKIIKVDGNAVRDAIKNFKTMRVEVFEVLEVANEYLPKTASKYKLATPRSIGPMIEVNNAACRIEEYPNSNAYHLRYRISNQETLVVLINQLYFPGWKVILGDNVFDDAYLLSNINKDGRIKIQIPASKNIYFEAFYDGPPGWYIRNIVICLVFIIILVLIAVEHRKHLTMPAQLPSAPPRLNGDISA